MNRPARFVRTRSQRLGAVVMAWLAILMPLLVAGVRIGAPSTAAERERLLEGVVAAEQPARAATLPARLVYLATAGDDVRTRLQGSAAVVDATVAQARLAMLLPLLLAGGLLYLLVSVTRGASTALLACLAFASLPAVMEDASAIRPEPLASVFALLGTVLLTLFVTILWLRRGRGTPRRAVLLLALMVLIGAAFGLAAGSLSSASVLLLVPAGALSLAGVAHTWTWIRLLRRRRIGRRLLAPLANRSWPWFGLAVFGMGSTVVVLLLLSAQAVTVARPSGSAFGMLPPPGVRAVLTAVLMVLGGTRLLLECGGSLSARRVHPNVVVLLFAAVLLMHHSLAGAGLCALLPACAVAVLVAEGAMTAIAMLLGALLVRAQRRREAA